MEFSIGERDQWMFSVAAERCCIFRIDCDESRQRGAAGSRRWSRVDERTHCGGVVWRRDGIDGRPVEGLRFDLWSRDGFVEDGGGDFRSMGARRHLCFFSGELAMVVVGTQGSVFTLSFC